MGRRPATFTNDDLARAMAVAKEHDMTVEVQADGTIRIVPIAAPAPIPPPLVRPVESF